MWQQWLENPEKFWVHRAFFRFHYGVGMGAAAYIFFMSLTGSMIVFRNELSKKFPIEWLVNLHANLFLGSTGRLVNGIGASCLILLCLTGAVIWWPGIKHWRRSMTVSAGANFPRFNWDLHSALGFWCFVFVLVWGVSGLYFAVPQIFNALFLLDPADRFTDRGLYALSQFHFGRFSRFTEALWTLLGLVPAVLAFTGFFICCRRVIFKKPSNPKAL